MKHLLTGLVVLLVLGVSAQKNDYVWLFGYGNEAATLEDTMFGGRTLDFNFQPAKVSKKLRVAGFDADNISYCDTSGNLLFYSNGIDIYDSRDSIMESGDSINYGWLWRNSARYNGLRVPQGMLALPKKVDLNYVFLNHFTLNRFFYPPVNTTIYSCVVSYYSLIDINGNNGLGSVVEKNIIVDEDTLSYSIFSAVQHGNGREWWLIHPRFVGNCYKIFLQRDDGTKLYTTQCIGADRLHPGAIGSSCFSPDGTKYFWVSSGDGIRMFDFDRCAGILSNSQIIPFPIPDFANTGMVIAGIAVSPSNQYLYVIGSRIALQYDLFATDIGASVDTVAIYDGVYDPSPFSASFYLAQIGPDGKIYISATNSIRSLHVINRPDEKGDSCEFVQRGIKLNAVNAFGIPNFPNYRLGKLTGSPCDTITGLSDVERAEKERILKVFPNPATDVVTIDYGFTDWSKSGEVSIEIVNNLGQVVHTQPVPQYSGFQKIQVNQYPAGIYTASIKRNGEVVATAKFGKTSP